MKNIFIALVALTVSIPAMAGGVSGGGGNSKPAYPVSAAEVTSMIKEARKYAAGFLNYLEILRGSEYIWRGHEGVPAKLFDADTTAVDWVESVAIHIEENGPCLDPSGVPMDGSASANPPRVCFSLPRLTEKLSKETLRGQIIALAVHEYSHLAGTTEEEADFLQAETIQRLIEADFNGYDRNFSKVWDSLVWLNVLAQGEWDEEVRDTPKLWEDMRGVFSRFGDDFVRTVRASPGINGFKMWNPRKMEAFQETSIRLFLMEKAGCELSKGKDSRKCKQHNDKVFHNDREIDYHTYMVRAGAKPGEFPEHPGVKFTRVRGIPEVQVELGRLKLETENYMGYIQAVRGY